MTETLFDRSSFAGSVPLFPLPNVVLFPHVVLPLHIFEPRYRRMTEDALNGDRLIAMGLLKPGWEPDYEGRPEVHPIVGVGKIVSEQRLPDGKFNLLLYGVSRARIVEEPATDKAYRIARVELLDDRTEGLDPQQTSQWSQALTDLLKQLAPQADIQPSLGFGTLLDQVAAVTLADPREKQQVLEELDVAERTRLLVGFLRAKLPGGPSKTPPKPSLN